SVWTYGVKSNVSSNQPIRNRVTNFRISGMKTAGIRMSAGWGNLIAEGRITDIGGNGLDIVGSPILSGWGGSGSVVRNLYAANCGTGISNFTGWCFTFINPVLEYDDTPFRERGNNSVWINPWLESNTNPPLIERGTVILGGRGISYRATLPDDLSSFEPLEAVTRIHNRGIQVFRDDTDRVFDVDGEGVKRIRSKTTAGLPLDGAITSFDSNRRNGFNIKCITNNTSPLIKTNPRNVSGVKGVATADSADGGSHYGRVVLYSGVVGATQNTVADRWELRFDGTFHPSTDNAYAFGRSSERPSVLWAATGTISTSDAREKTDLLPMDDAFLDAVDDISIGLYQWLVEIERKGDAARTHSGAIAQQVRDAFAAHGIDGTRYGLLCYDKWDDEWEDVYVDVRTPISDSEGVIVGYEVAQEPTGERRLIRAAGDRWSLREGQCHWALHASARRKAEKLERRLDAIEALISPK
ncbi:tail fiber domain-containing protein, partial [Aeromonas caviae]|uniref:tail fiber domain-containing protein n=1 Tax=Aeromonas caviae TaxID=648 RepID=UPI00385FF2B8